MTEPKRTAVITGGRDYTPTEAELQECADILRDFDVVLHGDCRGVDRTAAEYLQKWGWEVIACPADWEKHGKSAGPIRNREMLSRRGVRLLVAFKGGAGTWNCIRTAKALGRDVHIIGEGKW